MTTHPHQLAEIRKWKRLKDGVVAGYIHNDPNDIWDEGEYAAIGPFDSEVDSVKFIVFSKGKMSFKAMKDEEKKE